MGYLDIALQVGKSSSLREMDLGKEVLKDLFERAVSEVEACYLPGTLEMIREDFPTLSQEIEETADRVNEFWLGAGEGPVDVGVFREAVDRWKSLNLKAIRLFSITERPE